VSAILVLDGAMATLQLQTGLDAGAIHRAYLDAGANIIRTDTFSVANDQAAHAAARTAMAAVNERPRDSTWGPPSGGPPFGESFSRARVAGVIGIGLAGLDGLIDAGVDLLVAETLASTAQIDDTLRAVGQRRHAPPLMVSVAVTPAGRLVSGQTIDEVTRAIAGAPVWGVGLNCGSGIDGMRAPLETLASRCECLVACAPAAGLPDAFGLYDEPVARTVAFLTDAAVAGLLDIAGGCCGTTPGHTRAIAAAMKGRTRRRADAR
jgi:5-methyltetrahydrofolate--homocysteine methyltransferase